MDKFQCLARQEFSVTCPDRLRSPIQPRSHRVPDVGSLVVKQPEPKVDISFLSGTAVRNARSYTSASPHILMQLIVTTQIYIGYVLIAPTLRSKLVMRSEGLW